jgi:aspartate carbamoyltransferase
MINHIISIDQYNKNKLENFFRLVNRERYGYTHYVLTDKHQIATLFYEPSTRTSASFHSAAIQLGYSVLPINEVTYSSVTKGETLEDTIRTIGSYVDLIVLRHNEKGAAKRAAEVSTVPIINAGDGNGEHPTQTLLDIYTIWKTFKKINGLTITLMGDLKNGRTVHSLIKILRHYEVKINLISPDSLKLPKEYYKNSDIEYSIFPKDLQTDILYVTRVQKERGSKEDYKLSYDELINLPKNAIVMHPLPRAGEIPVVFDNDPRAKYFEQIKNGLLVRKALLRELLA